MLAKPPNLLVKYNADKIDKPYEGCTEEKNDGNNDSNSVLSIKALDKSVYCPYDIESGKTKNNLNNPRKIVKCLDYVFHEKTPLLIFR